MGQLLQDPAFQRAVQGGVKSGELCRMFPDYGRTTIKEAKRRLIGDDVPASSRPSIEKTETSDTLALVVNSYRPIRTLDELLAVAQVDCQEWEVERWSCNQWPTSAFNRETDSFNQVENWQIKASFKRRVQYLCIKREIEQLLADAEARMPSHPKLPRISLERGHLLEVSIPDLHMGKLAWAQECGDAYDVEIAEKVFREALGTLLHRASTFDIEKVLFVVGNDLLHVDGPKNQTFGGTPQDHDSRYHRTFLRSRRLMIEAVDELLKIANVDVMVVPGNHDQTAAWHLGDSLQCWYRNSEQVEIDNQPALRKYYEYGRVMLMFTHGDKERPISKLGQIAAAEMPEMWGRTLHREAHIGHLHHNEYKDEPGFSIRRLSSLSAADAWHKNSGYIGSPRRAETFIWDRDEGLISTQVYTVPTRQFN